MAARTLMFEEAVGSGIRAEIAREDAEARAAAALLKESPLGPG